MISSSTCHADRKAYALGLCRPCYERQRYNATKKHEAYRRWYEKGGREQKRAKYRNDPESTKQRVAAWQAAHPERTLDGRLRRAYGISLAEYKERLERQGGVCAVCGGVDRFNRALSVDHDHSCCPSRQSCGNCVRGLLCTDCNRAIGIMSDDPIRLMAAAAYVTAYS